MWWKKEAELATTSLEFEYLHQKSRCEMLTAEDDISNDVINLGTCFSMFVYRQAFHIRLKITPKKTCEERFDGQQNTTTTPARPVFPVDIIVVQM